MSNTNSIFNVLVSVIVPIYNAELYLHDCLQSITKQSHKNMEIILINDGSTDTSLQICKEYQNSDNRIVLIDKNNEGLSIARKTGIKQCEGEYFVTIDADDIVSEQYIEKLLSTIITYDADICLCARKEFAENWERTFLLDKHLPPVLNTKDVLVNRYLDIATKYQMSDSWNKMYRRQFVQESGVSFELPRQYNGTDMLFNYMLLLHEPKIAIVNKVLYHYRIVPNSRVHRKGKKLYIGFDYIHSRLREEAQKLNKLKFLEHQIEAAYVTMLKYASFDIYQYAVNKEEMIKEFNELKRNYDKYSLISFVAIINKLSLKLKIFYVILNTGNGEKLYYYYKLRERILQLLR